MKPKIRLMFSDMWGFGVYQFNPVVNYFYDLLSLQFEIQLVETDLDLLIFSCFGTKHQNISAKAKIFFCGENTKASESDNMIMPDYQKCNISLSQYEASERNYYFPLWALFVNWFYKPMPLPLPSNPTYLVEKKNLLSSRNPYTEFKVNDCCFLNNNPVEDRIYLYNSLCKELSVDSYGKLFNNVGYELRGDESDKCKILKNYKLTIAYENSYHHGYNTEKIIHPYSVGSLAIYSGGLDRTVFNSKSVFYLEDYNSLEMMIRDIVQCIKSPAKFLAKLNEPLFVNDNVPTFIEPVSVLAWILTKISILIK
jgi:alpha(1,3/1,4) fucosyltransferase